MNQKQKYGMLIDANSSVTDIHKHHDKNRNIITDGIFNISYYPLF